MEYFKQYSHNCKIYPTYNVLEKVILVLLFMKTKNSRSTNFHLVYNSEEFLVIFYCKKKHFIMKKLYVLKIILKNLMYVNAK
jgi:hypothetical protein